MAAPTRLVVLISGSGSNLQALIDAANTPALPSVHLTRVISDRKNAYGLTRAAAAAIPTTYHGILPFRAAHPASEPAARAAYDAALAALVLAESPALVVCAGFMRIVTPAFLDPLREKAVQVINLHPALHGDLVGAGCIERAWAEFELGKRQRTGIMIHYVIAEVDMGEPIVQAPVEIEGCQDLPALQERIHEAEHKLIVQGARMAIDALKK